MATMRRHKTDYPGVYYVIGKTPTGKDEKIFYIRYRRDGKMVEEKAGRQFVDQMTAARANTKRGQRIAGKQLSNKEKRAAERAKKEAELGKWTLDKLWDEYKKHKTPGKTLSTDDNRYQNYIKTHLGSKTPQELVLLDIDRIRLKLLKTKSPQTVKHVMGIIKRICNFGFNKGLTPALPFRIQMPVVDNKKTEDLTQDQIKKLLMAIDKDPNGDIGAMMKMALFTGMRRGEIFKLEWRDVDFHRGFIIIRDPKGGKSQQIPMNEAAQEVLKGQKKTKSPYVFPGEDGKERKSAQKGSRRIREAAGLPKDFRPFHGLRHVYASMLASSGKVDMYTLQKLLTHKSPVMTQRYAHLRDDAMQRAAGLAGHIIDEAMGEKKI